MAKVNYPTDAEIAAAFERGKLDEPYDAKRLAYRPGLDVIELDLRNGVCVLVPRAMIGELASLPLSVVKKMRLGPFGESIDVRSHDIHISVRGLLRDVVGANIACIGGKVKSPAKAAAARTNGQLGGRPRKVPAKA